MLYFQPLFWDFFSPRKLYEPDKICCLLLNTCCQLNSPYSSMPMSSGQLSCNSYQTLAPDLTAYWFPLWNVFLLNYHARDFFERVVVPRWTYRDYDSVPRAAQLLSVKHNEWACCCHHFVIQLLYSSRNNYPVSVFLLTESFYLCSSITSKT